MVNAGFYEIRYAYPSSEMAKELKRNASGCYYVLLDGSSTNEPYNLLHEAVEFAQGTGYIPSFYSLDVYTGGI